MSTTTTDTPTTNKPSLNSQGTAFRSLSVSIAKGFLRDKGALFFALIFPLMFLVLFGGCSTPMRRRGPTSC
ncbi:TadE/TadG family type IV pilus assembly protein [Nocardioides alcanivorans]|uniref:TadE/TadG family type IV pilus assembly protein n=1 Tax=Nocardioides alcanivorans TaxID=2897352 RepID=UPI001F1F82D7|nr:hypothetical protein [Nocardioides alcanivorans]